MSAAIPSLKVCRQKLPFHISPKPKASIRPEKQARHTLYTANFWQYLVFAWRVGVIHVTSTNFFVLRREAQFF